MDAASLLRMDDKAVICLDPVNNQFLKESLANGMKTFVGGNCTVSLMLMGLGGLFQQGLVEWISSMTYQAASGAGAKNMIELINQMKFIGDIGENLAKDSKGIIEIDQRVSASFNHPHFPKENFGYPLAGNLLPWIDVPVEYGMSKEEWKGMKKPAPITKCNVVEGAGELLPIDKREPPEGRSEEHTS